MTVIAWDGKTLAADKRTSIGGLHATTTKVRRIDGCLVAGCGTVSMVREVIEWLVEGCDPKTFPASCRDGDNGPSVLVVGPDGALSQYENGPYPLLIENKQWAIGIGRDFALAAMRLGKTASEAVEIASHFASGCGNGVDALELAP